MQTQNEISMKNILNIAAYKFVNLPAEQLSDWRSALKTKANECYLKGTILLSIEGINLFLAGEPDYIQEFQNFLQQYPQLKNLHYQQSWSDFQPFKRLLVRLKKEIISMGYAQIQPEKQNAPYIHPKILRQWFEQGQPMVVLDTRNDYEVKLGTFDKAMELNIKNFRHFPQAIKQLPPEIKDQPIVTFCTGGIRCEKAALWLQSQGFKNVYQLQGGILNYFAECGEDFFHGKCFVFDDRNTIDSMSMQNHAEKVIATQSEATGKQSSFPLPSGRGRG